MKRIAFAVVAIMLPFSFAGCDADTGTYEDTTPDGVVTYDDGYDPSDPGGIGMTYNGKLGYDYGNGFVQPFDGTAPGLGYGF